MQSHVILIRHNQHACFVMDLDRWPSQQIFVCKCKVHFSCIGTVLASGFCCNSFAERLPFDLFNVELSELASPWPFCACRQCARLDPALRRGLLAPGRVLLGTCLFLGLQPRSCSQCPARWAICLSWVFSLHNCSVAKTALGCCRASCVGRGRCLGAGFLLSVLRMPPAAVYKLVGDRRLVELRVGPLGA